ncbi:MAG: hypothetical protein ACRDTQ_01995 [Micromonosporaceae bacterium]
MSYLWEVSNTLTEMQTALEVARDRCELAASQAQLAYQTAQSLGSASLITGSEELQRVILAVRQQLAETCHGAALATHEANELASGATV